MIYDNGRKNSIRDELKPILKIIISISRELKLIKSSLKKQGNEHSVKLRKLWTVCTVIDKVDKFNKTDTPRITTEVEGKEGGEMATRYEANEQFNLQDHLDSERKKEKIIEPSHAIERIGENVEEGAPGDKKGTEILTLLMNSKSIMMRTLLKYKNDFSLSRQKDQEYTLKAIQSVLNLDPFKEQIEILENDFNDPGANN